MMPIGALAGGWIVSLAELGLGREAALRFPYLVGATGCVALWVYGRSRLRLRRSLPTPSPLADQPLAPPHPLPQHRRILHHLGVPRATANHQIRRAACRAEV